MKFANPSSSSSLRNTITGALHFCITQFSSHFCFQANLACITSSRLRCGTDFQQFIFCNLFTSICIACFHCLDCKPSKVHQALGSSLSFVQESELVVKGTGACSSLLGYGLPVSVNCSPMSSFAA